MTLPRIIWALNKYGLSGFTQFVLAEARVIRLRHVENSYSQLREDLIIDKLLNYPAKGLYLDVGANDPIRFNNTHRFYKRGWSGINIDPNKSSINKFTKIRTRDTNLRLAIGNDKGINHLYVFDPDTLSTLSKQESKLNRAWGGRLLRKEKIKVTTLADICNQYIGFQTVDFLSIDAEGNNYEVLKSNDWVRCRPRVVCVEGLEAKNLTLEGRKILRYMKSLGYKEAARTFCNLIFVDPHFAQKFNLFQNSRCVLVTHRSAPAHGDDIRQYFINKKCAKFWFIAHEFAQVETRRTYIETFEKGQLVNKVYGPDFRILPDLLVFAKDILSTIWLLLTVVRKADLYVGASAFDTLPGIICKKIIQLRATFFLTIDFVPKRFAFPILNKIYILIDKYSLLHSTQTWNPSPRMAEGREIVWGYPKSYRSRQVNMPFGIWLDQFPVSRKKTKEPTLIFSGHLVPKQGVQLALESMPLILKSQPKTKLIVIGKGEYLPELQKIAQRLHISKQVSFLGYVDPATQSRLLLSSWIGLATFDPQLDTFSYYADPGKIKTYLGHGLPVVLTDVPYIAQVVNQKKAGKMIKYDPRDFADAIIGLISNPALLRQYSQNARSLAESFDWNRTLDAQLIPYV
ncbi:MAG: hypothetical protein US96_C0002G0023 [Candidatus Woesebacteria bacterium GW2011_GWB1_38_5b]|uniref:Methyltransferase FkbM domain-containing protein n=1 Tax=Candidatus Woesebacteria bacterium GW2011_GWB1_38_5b TaxID=1618569 RepID=A0A0G0KK80_9BACT|nr:MAG: hypothetical protein US96_C0002G0023 [Candidatus Woesebacteria bacterium GW2011_GWB1_38_5b]